MFPFRRLKTIENRRILNHYQKTRSAKLKSLKLSNRYFSEILPKYQVCPCMTSIFLCLIIEFAMCTNAYCKGAWCRFKICCSDLLRRRELKESFQVVPNYKIEIPTFNLLCEICKSARLGVTGVTHIGTCCRTAEKTWLLTTSVYANALIGLVSM